MAKRSLLRRILVPIVAVVVGLGAILALAVVILSKPLPRGEAGPAADALAHAVEKAVNKEAWERTQAVTWFFGGRNHHLWDRRRMYDRVRFGDVEVQVDLTTRRGVAFRGGVPIEGSARDKLVNKAHAAWINDSFWLNPLAKLFDDGVSRSRIAQPDGGPDALLISYSSGGLTPGDSYLWLLDANQRPVATAMWVSIIPVKGLRFSFDGWLTLLTGALISTEHKVGPVTLRLTDVAGAPTLAELSPGPDPFAALAGH
jgi:hypothetical protein